MSAGFDTGARRYRIVFDGGSKGNPGIGYGSYRIQPEGGPWSEPYRLEFGDKVTNNEAEYRSLIAAFEHLAESGSAFSSGSTEVLVISAADVVAGESGCLTCAQVAGLLLAGELLDGALQIGLRSVSRGDFS